MKKRKKWNKVGIFIVIIFFISLFLYWQNTSIVLTKLAYSNAKIPVAFEGYKILQVSDLHNQEFGKGQAKLIEYTEEVQPDIIVITGDLIDSHDTNIETAMKYVSSAIKIAPIYFVSGNHELWSGKYSELQKRLLEAGVVILENSRIDLEKKGDMISLYGFAESELKSSNYPEKNEMTEDIGDINEKEPSGFSLLLSHRPEVFELYCKQGFDLVFSGHAHGGQFRLPFLGGLYAPSQGFFPSYTSGLYEKNGTSMIVSRGLGNSVIPIRLFNRPEVVCVTLGR